MRISAILITLLCPLLAWADAAKPTYDDDVAPVLRQHCQGCHNADKQRGGFNLASYAALKMGGSSGEVVTPGDPDKSRLYTMTAHKEEPVMPPAGSKIPDAQLELLRKWIELGAAENKGSKVALSVKPRVDLALKVVGRGKPDGPPPMPSSLPLEPVHHARRAGSVVALATSPWAPLFAVGGQKQIVLLHADSGALLGILPFPHGQINSLTFSRSGKLILAAGGRGGLSGRAVLYDLGSGKTVAEVGSAETDAILSADLSADQSTIAVGTTSRLVRVYQVSDGAVLHTIKKHTDWVTAVEYSPDGVLLASADRNGGLFVWEGGTAREFHTLRGPTEAVNDLSWRGDSNLLASASLDGTTRLWEMQDGREVKKWNAHGPGTESVDFLADGRLVTTGRDKLTRLWDAAGKQLRQFPPTPDIGLRVAASHDGSKVVTGDWAGTVQIWTSAGGEPVVTTDANPAPVATQLKLAEAEVVKCQARLDQAKAAQTQVVAGAKPATERVGQLDANAKRLAADQQANQKQSAEAEAQIKTLTLELPTVQAAVEKLTAERPALAHKAEARRALATATALASKELQAAATKSPANPELQTLAQQSQKQATMHAADAARTDAEYAAAEATLAGAAARRQAVDTARVEWDNKLKLAQKRAGELTAALKATNDAVPAAKAADAAAQKGVAAARVALATATAAFHSAQARLTQLQTATVKK